MKTIGIVSEYNPFHQGHAWHVEESRRQAAYGKMGDTDYASEILRSAGTICDTDTDTAVVAVMSGDFVQRGEAAVFSKYARAEAACRSGVDLVIELPLPWALASAEGFARGAVSLLASLGAAYLSFGSESAGKLTELKELAGLLLDPLFVDEVRDCLKKNPAQSFASARQICAERRLQRAAPELQQPNNILALEYLKAIRELNLSMTPLAVMRRGALHDQAGESDFPSASELRNRVRGGREISTFVPGAADAVFRRESAAGRIAADLERQDLLMLSRLRFLKEEDFLTLPDASDGLGKRLYRAVRRESSYDAVIHAAATRRYPLARVRRLCCCAALGIKENDRSLLPPFARILAFNEKGRALLRNAAERAEVPTLTKPAQVSGLGTAAREIFECDANAHDFYTLLYSSAEQRICGEDWRNGPVICS